MDEGGEFHFGQETLAEAVFLWLFWKGGGGNLIQWEVFRLRKRTSGLFDVLKEFL